eukprot:4259990-Alexandrium_andersonii.AAC.1
MSASLVGSEMCIRDRPWTALDRPGPPWTALDRSGPPWTAVNRTPRPPRLCLLYTSDAADDM